MERLKALIEAGHGPLPEELSDSATAAMGSRSMDSSGPLHGGLRGPQVGMSAHSAAAADRAVSMAGGVAVDQPGGAESGGAGLGTSAPMSVAAMQQEKRSLHNYLKTYERCDRVP